MSRKERTLPSIEDIVDASIQALKDYIKKSKETAQITKGSAE